MIHRFAVSDVEQGLGDEPCVLLLGPRQVGKTTLARSIAEARGNALYLDLERPADFRKLDDADAYFRARMDELHVIDEVQLIPGLFPIIRGVVDELRRRNGAQGKFLFLGSAALELLRQASETLAGRISYVELTPFTALETQTLGPTDVLWMRGGYPESFLAPTDAISMRRRTAYIRSYLERDIPIFAPRLPGETVGRLWTMLAHAQGGQFNASVLARNLSVSASAINRYVDVLVDLFMVRRLQPWSANLGKRLVRAPKLYIRDSGLLHALLDIHDINALLGHPVVGASWEGFVIENIINAAGPARRPFYFRTQDGAEIDLILERGGEVEYAIEIKRSTAPTLSKGFHFAREALQPRHAVLVHPGSESWPMKGNVNAVGLVELLGSLRR